MSHPPATPPESVPDPSTTLPVDLTAAELAAWARDDALARALVSEDEDVALAWQPCPTLPPQRDWDADTGTWTEPDDAVVPDPSWVDADDICGRESRVSEAFSFPEWATDDSLLAGESLLPIPRSGVPRFVAMTALGGVALAMFAWFVLG